MRAIWEAISTRFKGDAVLVKVGRALYFGLPDDMHKSPPYWYVLIEEQNSDLDTFDTDIETYRLRFRLMTSDLRGLNALDIVDAFRRVFDDGLLQHADFEDTTAMFLGASGPSMDPGEPFTAELLYEVVAQRVVDTPLVRG